MSEHIRIKFGPDPYQQAFTCAACRERFERGGIFLRLDAGGDVVDVPVCPACWDRGDLLEGVIDTTRHDPSHPIGLA